MKHITIAILAILSAIPFTPVSSQSSCDPLFRLKGLYDPSLPNDQEAAIFGDDVKDELMINRFDGKDKEYGDIDGDGDIDRTELFSDPLDEYYWYYDNNGLKLAQLRFYPGVGTPVWGDPEPLK